MLFSIVFAYVFFYVKGIASQTILTIPMSQQVNSSEQFAQTIAASNNFSTNQQVHQHQKQQGSHQMPNMLASASLLSQQKQQQGLLTIFSNQ